MPVDCNVIRSIRDILIPALRISQPRAQMFLVLAVSIELDRQNNDAAGYLVLVLFRFWLDVSFVHVRKAIDLREAVDHEGVSRVEGMAVHSIDGESRFIRTIVFDESVA